MAIHSNRERLHGLLQVVGQDHEELLHRARLQVRSCGGCIVGSHGTRIGSQLFALNIIFSAFSLEFDQIERTLACIAIFKPRLLRLHSPTAQLPTDGLAFEATVYSFRKKRLIGQMSAFMAFEHLEIIQFSSVIYPAPFAGRSLCMTELIVHAPSFAAANRAGKKLLALARKRDWDAYWRPVSHSPAAVTSMTTYAARAIPGEDPETRGIEFLN